jgi:hypothetical protein
MTWEGVENHRNYLKLQTESYDNFIVANENCKFVNMEADPLGYSNSNQMIY